MIYKPEVEITRTRKIEHAREWVDLGLISGSAASSRNNTKPAVVVTMFKINFGPARLRGA